ncbi:TPA: hypothetical protein MIH26_21255 [Klebsiella pneumoniae]|nr:hypothetical protein [Klebsiella pneumoniae]THH57047.1 hypothetical protein E9152_25155 [Klebsiella pneumoniae subsp. pneumoniae]MBC4414913.1 hypothetical protein [Klebsiella pneumoniae]MBC4712346.1 hypothetical protein [Klebsiella pneumoniae]MBC4717758.1 hypothetical protein [Klebsiella pneumoniae]
MEKQLCTASDTTDVAAGDKHSPAAVCSVLAGFLRDDKLFLRRIWAVDVLDGVADLGDAPLFACKINFISGVLFGLTMALFHLWRRKVNKLPDWKDL